MKKPQPTHYPSRRQMEVELYGVGVPVETWTDSEVRYSYRN
jgi:hypothetical protein